MGIIFITSIIATTFILVLTLLSVRDSLRRWRDLDDYARDLLLELSKDEHDNSI